MSKSRDAFRTISEVSELLDTPAHVLRFWESKFAQVKPVKRAGGRRYYRPADVDLLAGIKQLLHDDGMTIKGAQKMLREQGIKKISALGAAGLLAEENKSAAVDETSNDDPVADTVDHVDATVVAENTAQTSSPEPKAQPDAAVALNITNVVPMPAPQPQRPAVSLNLAPKPKRAEPAIGAVTTATSVTETIPTDPSDADSKAPARLFHLLHKAAPDKLAAQAKSIAPLLARMQVLRNRIAIR